KMRATDPRGQMLLQNVEEDMEKALAELKRASDSVEPLVPAIASEQSAYQSLLRLASREHMISRQRRQQGGGQSGAQANRQQQLDQLELKQDENRYETQRQARRRQTPEQQEQSGVLSRLKELAQR